MACDKSLTSAYLRSILNYDPETGIWTWKWRDDVRLEDNKRWAGKEVGIPSKNGNGYGRIGINHVLYYTHRLAFLWMLSAEPIEVDHEDLNRSNCKWVNLRPSTHSQNNMNKSLQSNNKSGFKGVYWDKRRGKWQASIEFNGKKKYIGRFDEIQDAASAYKKAAKELHGEFARTV